MKPLPGLPKPGTIADVRQSMKAAPALPDVEDGAGKFFGIWPGNETDEQLMAAIDEIRKPDDKDAIIGQPDEVPCMDCGRPYPHGLDTVLTKKQWLMIHPDDGGVLCPSCIVNRAAKLPGVIGLYGCIILDEHLDLSASLESMIAAMRLENADYCRTTAESLHVQGQQAETIRQMTEVLKEYREWMKNADGCDIDQRCFTCIKADLLLKETP